MNKREEILNKHWINHNSKESDSEQHLNLSLQELETIDEAMAESNKQEAINFAEWVIYNNYHYHGSTWHYGVFYEKRYTTEQLYSLYQKEQSLNK